MRRVLQATGLGAVMTLVVGSAYLGLEVFVLGLSDPKWGGPWDNFQLGFYLLAITIGVEAAVFVAFGAISGRLALSSRLSRIVAALAMAAATLLVWLPKATSPIVMACLVSALALLGGSVATWLRTLRGGLPEERERVAGA